MDIYEKSLEILTKIIENQKKMGYKIYLIGGWAVWAYNPYLKSKDIDFIVEKKDFYKLKDFIISLGFKETSGEHLNKKGFSMLWNDGKIEIDVYIDKVSKFDIDKLIENSIKDIYSSIWLSLLKEGFSVSKEKYLYELYEVRPLMLYKYSLKSLTPVQKVQFDRGLDKLLEEINGTRLVRSVVLIPLSESGRFEAFLKTWKIEYETQRYELMPKIAKIPKMM